MESSPVKDLVAIVVGTAGVGVYLATIPLQGYLMAKDIMDSLAYTNLPTNLGYNLNRPTPNHVDFPNGPPSPLQRTRRFYSWMQDTFIIK